MPTTPTNLPEAIEAATHAARKGLSGWDTRFIDDTKESERAGARASLDAAYVTAQPLLYGKNGLEPRLKKAADAKEVMSILRDYQTFFASGLDQVLVSAIVDHYLDLFRRELETRNEEFRTLLRGVSSDARPMPTESEETLRKNIRAAIQASRVHLSAMDKKFMEANANCHEETRAGADGEYPIIHALIYSRAPGPNGLESRLLAAKDAKELPEILAAGEEKIRELRGMKGNAFAAYQYEEYIANFKVALGKLNPDFQAALAEYNKANANRNP